MVKSKRLIKMKSDEAFGGRFVAGRPLAGSVKQNEYRNFVKKHVNSMPGATPQQRMKAVAEKWHEHKHK